MIAITQVSLPKLNLICRNKFCLQNIEFLAQNLYTIILNYFKNETECNFFNVLNLIIYFVSFIEFLKNIIWTIVTQICRQKQGAVYFIIF